MSDCSADAQMDLW